MKARIAVLGTGVLLSSAGFGMMHAQAATIEVPAPSAVATAVAVKVGDIASVGETGAQATESGSGATAKPIALGDTPLLSGTGLTSKTAEGSFLDTGDTALGRVAVAPWSTTVGSQHASSSAALATAELNGVGDVAVAPSSSFAMWTPAKSNSSAVSDGAVINLGEYTIKVLHAESGSSAKGKTFLVQIIGRDLALTTSEGCLLDLGPVATVGCLQALSGVGSDADIAKAIIGENGPVGKVVAASAKGGAGVAASSSVLGQQVSRAANATPLLARTGTSALVLIAFGLMLIVAGATALHGNRHMRLVPLKHM